MTESGSGWRHVINRLRAGSASTPTGRARRSGWSLAVPVIALAAGLLFTTSATSAERAPLREDRQLALTDLIEERAARVAELEQVIGPLAEEVARLTDELAGTAHSAANPHESRDELAAGLTPLRGPGVTVQLDDALRPDGVRPPGASADDLLVHQQDVQAVVNALWAGGAEAMTIMGERVISTSAVLCVGPVLLLHGRPYSPPYRITAIGDPDRLRAALDTSPEVQLFREAADAYGLGYQVVVEQEVTVPAYGGSSTIRLGQVPR
ncbi:MAG TPA: DUF881 domain-containing protein [Natronosporangium sp.]|nr:DUF881 domain-containing protein [Natronosporangium sp.]